MRLLKKLFFPIIILVAVAAGLFWKEDKVVQVKESWISLPSEDWPNISLVNDIQLFENNKRYRNTGCAFLIDTGRDTLAVTAKHIYVALQSVTLNTISFEDVIKKWKMFPKNMRTEEIIVDQLINEDTSEIINRNILESDCLVFSIKKKSDKIKPLKIREGHIRKREKLYVIGWSENDRGKPRIYEGKYVGSLGEKILIDMKGKTNEVGMGGAPVIDSKGYLIGILSTNQGKLSKPSSVFCLKEVIKAWETQKYPELNKSRRIF